MFNSSNNKSTSKGGSDTRGGNLPSVNMISEGTRLKGNLNTKNDIRIAGSLEGEAEAGGKLIITSSGRVEGDVEAVDADVAGTLNGEIHVKNKLVVRQSAVIDGDIHTKTLLVEEGAQINGTCDMGEESNLEAGKAKDRGTIEASIGEPGERSES